MATENALTLPGGLVAGADLSAKQYFFVEMLTARTVTLVNAATDRPLGVLLNDPKSGEGATVAYLGLVKVWADATVAIAVNDYIGPDANGKAIKKATADNVVVGIAAEALASGTAIIEVYLVPVSFFRTAA